MTPQVVDTAKMSFYDQLKLVRGSNIIIGVHGAGLMFIMFAAEEVRRKRKCGSRVKDEQRGISREESRERSRDRGRNISLDKSSDRGQCRERKCKEEKAEKHPPSHFCGYYFILKYSPLYALSM